MSPSRRLSNGRSPLVRKQCQITSFFSLGKSPTPNPSPNPSHSICSNSPPLQGESKQKKPLLVVTPPSVFSHASPSSVHKKRMHSFEVVGRRIKVFWPLDNAWYEGCVRSFDEASEKHVIQYDDAEEELLDLEKEKFEWLEVERPRNLRRLRRMSHTGSSVSSTPLESGKVEVEEESSKEASTDDEEWDRVSLKEATEGDSEDLDLENEGDIKDEVVSRSRKGVASCSSKLSSRPGKRRKIAVENMDCIRTVKFDDQDDNTEHKTPVDIIRSSLTHHVTSSKKLETTLGMVGGPEEFWSAVGSESWLRKLIEQAAALVV
ncbi:DNA mismatch repair protein MSH6 [Platanthera guangdongensis]|uniref:DNA mismatch repair protein MSH6 n=1 Tax=Platanthera guangdongensis TaxID=2320717 RepID=A0ABR2M395_9ASPA